MKQTVQGLVLAMLLCGLVACVSTPVSIPVPQPQVDAERRSTFDKELDSWHGATVKELIAKLGQPGSTSRQADGRLVYVYAKSAKLSGPSGPSTFSCVVRYIVDAGSGRVVGHRIEGC